MRKTTTIDDELYDGTVAKEKLKNRDFSQIYYNATPY